MISAMKFSIFVLVLATACLAQEGMTVHFKGKQKWPAAEAEKIYFSACSAVQREFGGNRAVRPQVTVVLGAEKDEVLFDQREITLTKWDRQLFAEGVVIFAFEDLMPVEQRLMLAKRAVIWADSTADVERLNGGLAHDLF
jgi:hypothetical protein